MNNDYLPFENFRISNSIGSLLRDMGEKLGYPKTNLVYDDLQEVIANVQAYRRLVELQQELTKAPLAHFQWSGNDIAQEMQNRIDNLGAWKP